jgi:hypothetical protein
VGALGMGVWMGCWQRDLLLVANIDNGVVIRMVLGLGGWM